MELLTNTQYKPDLMEIVKLYFPKNFQEVEIVIQCNIINSNEGEFDSYCRIEYNGRVQEKIRHCTLNTDELMTEKKLLKISLYELMAEYFSKDMPWGALTGIRPTKMAHDLLKKGKTIFDACKYMQDTYHISDQKISLVEEIVTNQANYILYDNNMVNLYINIPFCVSRCSYCSFISALIKCSEKLIDPYIEAVIKEIECVKDIIKNNKYKVKSIYIGGGTPTSFTAEQLERILKHIDYKVSEFTIEAGRPDTITQDKLELFKKYGVTRICVNPQTFNDEILKNIGRTHTSQDIVNIYKMARNYPFKINMDFIAGLSGETIESFKESINKAVELSPDSITVHTLSLKRASTYSNEQTDIFEDCVRVESMVDFAREKLMSSGYSPYYMYRQKNMLSGLENVSYARNKSFSVFNIDSMEEISTILACGANGISKRVYTTENRIERQANLKDIKEYVTRIDELIEKKKKFFE